MADVDTILESIGRRRGCLVSGGVVDLDKARRIILQDYRNTKLGTITLEPSWMKNRIIQKMVRKHVMDKDIFAKLKVADIKALFETEQALEILPLAQEDTRSSVQKLAASYIKRQEKRAKRTTTFDGHVRL